MKHMFKDFFNFGRKRTNTEAALFLIFHSGVFLAVMSLIGLVS